MLRLLRSRYLAFLRPKLREARAVSLFFFQQTHIDQKKNSVENTTIEIEIKKNSFFPKYIYISQSYEIIYLEWRNSFEVHREN